MSIHEHSVRASILDFVSATTDRDEALINAEEAANEFGLDIPDALTGEFLEFIAAQVKSAITTAWLAAGPGGSHSSPSGIVMSPACGVIGLHLFRGFAASVEDDLDEETARKTVPTSGNLTCIEPEMEYQAIARQAFVEAGLKPSLFRFLPSAPLDVIGKLASESYDLAVIECPIEELIPTILGTLPALRPGGIIVALDALVDGLVGDLSRADRTVITAREVDADLRETPGIRISRLPIGAGSTIITKLA